PSDSGRTRSGHAATAGRQLPASGPRREHGGAHPPWRCCGRRRVQFRSVHWFAHELALVEIRRVLRPTGSLALLWNRPDGKPEPAIRAVEELLAPAWPDGIHMPLDLDPSRMPHARDWARADAWAQFEPLEHRAFSNVHVVDREGLVAYFGSMG